MSKHKHSCYDEKCVCHEEIKSCVCHEKKRNCFCDEMAKYIGETVTIYTTSGGPSGGGFTGVLMCADECSIRLIVCQGPTPCCAIGDGCADRRETRDGCGELGNGFTNNRESRERCRENRFGAVAQIPCDRIACFVHNAV